MNKRTILISILIAVLLGVFLGVVIGFASGFFNKGNSADSSEKPNAEMVTDKDQLLEKERAKEKEIEKAAKDKVASEKSDGEKATKEKKTSDSRDDERQDSKDKKDNDGKSGTVATGNGQSLNVRASADPASNIIGGAADGANITILGRENGMVHVRTEDGVEGWVSGQFVNG